MGPGGGCLGIRRPARRFPGAAPSGEAIGSIPADGVDEPADRVLIQSFRAIPMGSIPSFAHHPASSRERWRSRW